jgi:hypothetical protein
MPRWLLDKAESFANGLSRIERNPTYQRLSDVGRVLKVCRWAIVALVVVSILLWKENQGRDALLSLIDPQDRGLGQMVRVLLFIATAALWAVISWYFPRLRLYLWREGHEAGRAAKVAATVIPRVLGSLCLVVVGAATWRARVPDSPRGVAVVLLLMGFLFYPAAAYRRWRLRSRQGDPLVPPPSVRAMLFAGAEVGVASGQPPREVLIRFARGFSLVAALAAFWLILMVALAVSPVRLAQFIGSPSAALLAASFWTAFATAVGVLSDRTRIPFAVLVVVWALVISPTADNHVVKPLPAWAPARPQVGPAFHDWLDEQQTTDGQEVPVFFVFAEGGGIRAAYWTAAVLGELADENAAFAEHVFAVSGVSGGSWGATVYTAVRAWMGRQGWMQHSSPPHGYGHTVTLVHEVLRHDFLSPVMAGLLLRDPVQWLLPFVHVPDRGRAFEQGWEDAWRRSLDDDTLANSFLDLRGPGLPHLFLGSTWVERGGPMVISDLALPQEVTNDFFSTFTRDVRASTAAHLSSRFPGFNPPATIEHGIPMHLVDGGYYDNSGAETLLHVIDLAVSAAAERHRRIRPIVIAIHNDIDLAPGVPPALTWVPEISAPLSGAVNVLKTNAGRSEAVLRRWRSPAGAALEILPFNLEETRKAVPLGWSLSEAAMKEMDEQILHRNQCQRHKIKAVLGSGRPRLAAGGPRGEAGQQVPASPRSAGGAGSALPRPSATGADGEPVIK